MNEIDEFLKRAAAMRARRQQASGGGAAPAPPAAPSPSSAPLRPMRNPPVEPIDTEVIQDAEVVADNGTPMGSVARHVSQQFDTNRFRDSTSHLGERVKSSDEAIEAHLHETFEHRLGQLGASTASAQDSTLDEEENIARAAAAAEPVPLPWDSLRSPRELRNAFILAEILNPPRHRWS